VINLKSFKSNLFCCCYRLRNEIERLRNEIERPRNENERQRNENERQRNEIERLRNEIERLRNEVVMIREVEWAHKEQEIRNQIANQFEKVLDENKKQREAMLKKALESNSRKYEAEVR